jgi:uncharacterized membrane protein YkvA (DUF1232 family)
MIKKPVNGNEYDEFDIPLTEEEYTEKEQYVKENFGTKLESLGHGIKFAKHLIALFRYMTNGAIPWYKKSVVIGGLAYFILPFDAIPDILPLIGYLDDFGVIAAVLGFLGKELKPYYISTVGFGSYDESES